MNFFISGYGVNLRFFGKLKVNSISKNTSRVNRFRVIKNKVAKKNKCVDYSFALNEMSKCPKMSKFSRATSRRAEKALTSTIKIKPAHHKTYSKRS